MARGGKRVLVTKKKKKASVAKRAGKYLYRTLVVLSAIIVGVYVVHALAVREPEMAPPPTPPQSTGQTVATDNPDTSVDESQLTGVNPPEWERRDKCYNFLLLASDQSSGNTDTIIVVRYDIASQAVSMVSVPRDSLVERTCNGKTYHKINAAYAYGGVEELKAAVTELLGVPIDFYVKVDINAFVRLVDQVGGIDFEVPVRMCYDDPTQDLHIHYDKGWHYGLNGQQVLEIARCRSNSDGDPNVNYGVYPAYPDSDIGRTRTQQQILVTIAKKMLSWNSLTMIKDYVKIFNENVETDLKLDNMLWFAERVYEGFDLSTGISTATLPGDGMAYYAGASVYELYPDQVLEMVNTMLNPYQKDLTAERLKVFQIPY